MKRSFAPFVTFALVSLASIREAAATQADTFIAGGALLGFSAHLDNNEFYGVLGGEATFTTYPWKTFEWGFGAFAQVQAVGFDHARGAFGAQVNSTIFGVELGPFLEQGSGPFGTTLGLQASPFVSVAFVSLAVRVGVPIVSLTKQDPWGVDLGLVIALKWPVGLNGEALQGL